MCVDGEEQDDDRMETNDDEDDEDEDDDDDDDDDDDELWMMIDNYGLRDATKMTGLGLTSFFPWQSWLSFIP